MLVEVIQSLDNTGELIVSRFPEDGEADLKLGAQLIVRQTQTAVFFRSGKALDTFGPGRHTLVSGNLPLLGELLNWAVFRGDTPFKAEVIFTNHKVFTNQKWGTKEPVLFRDRELSMVRLRAFGIHSFRVTDAHRFVDTIVGTQGIVTSPQIADFLRNIIIGRLADFLGETLQTIFDLPSSYDEIGTAMKARIRDDFGKYGLSVEDFIISAITPPEEVQKRIDERSSMALFGNLDHYMKYKTAQALQDAAQQPGGTAGAGVGAGLGLGVGLGMLGGLQQALQPGQAAAPTTQPGAPAAGGSGVRAVSAGQRPGRQVLQRLRRCAAERAHLSPMPERRRGGGEVLQRLWQRAGGDARGLPAVPDRERAGGEVLRRLRPPLLAAARCARPKL